MPATSPPGVSSDSKPSGGIVLLGLTPSVAFAVEKLSARRGPVPACSLSGDNTAFLRLGSTGISADWPGDKVVDAGVVDDPVPVPPSVLPAVEPSKVGAVDDGYEDGPGGDDVVEPVSKLQRTEACRHLEQAGLSRSHRRLN
jgi:hypothetical protein